MANQKISELSSKATPVSADEFVINDIAGGGNKKVTYSNLESNLSITESQISDLGTYSTATGVENNADVTDTANVTAAGALMDSEVTNLAQVKAFDTTDYATAAQGTLADSAQQPPTEGAFVDGDKTKLDGIEASADVTDTTNVTAAGALMDSEVTNLAQVKAFDSSDYAAASHTHTHADITDYDTELAGKTNTTAFTPSADYHVATKKYVDDNAGGAPEGTVVLSTGEAGGTKFLREDGDGTCSWQTITGGGDALTSNPLSQFAATTSAQLAGVLSDETGSGAAVFGTSPTLTTPALGTPSALVLTNATGLPEAQVTNHEAAITITESQISDLGTYSTATGVENNADVTDTANVTAAGALMDSELTDITAVKGINQDLTTTSDVTFADITYTTAIGGVSALGNLGTTEVIDWATASHFTGNLDNDITITHSNETSGQKITLVLSYSGAQRTITWSHVDVWTGGTAPTAPVSGETLIVTLLFVGTTCLGSYELFS